MPKMVTMELDPGFKPADNAQKLGLDLAKKKGSFTVDYRTALENIKQSKGMYRIASETPQAPNGPTLEEMDRESLLVMALSLGMKTQKQMTVDGLRQFIRQKMSEIELVDE